MKCNSREQKWRQRVLRQGRRQVNSKINYWYQMWLVFQFCIIMFWKAMDLTFLWTVFGVGGRAHTELSTVFMYPDVESDKRNYSIWYRHRLLRRSNVALKRYLIQSNWVYPDFCFWKPFTKVNILLFLSIAFKFINTYICYDCLKNYKI